LKNDIVEVFCKGTVLHNLIPFTNS